LFVDDDLVVVNKPSGLLVHRGWANDDDVAMFRVRDALGAHVYPVHRLDRGTSGALVFARTREAAATLSLAFESGLVDKRYLALVRGSPAASGTIDHPIPKGERGPRVPAVTHFSLVARSSVDRCSLVLARPETGRGHQIRRHLRHGAVPRLSGARPRRRGRVPCRPGLRRRPRVPGRPGRLGGAVTTGMTDASDWPFANPVLTASGCGGTGRDLAAYGDLAALGGFVTRSVTRLARPGSQPPRLVESPSGLVNAIGLQNPGAEAFLRTSSRPSSSPGPSSW